MYVLFIESYTPRFYKKLTNEEGRKKRTNEWIERERVEGSKEEWKHLFKASIEIEIEWVKNTRGEEAVEKDVGAWCDDNGRSPSMRQDEQGKVRQEVPASHVWGSRKSSRGTWTAIWGVVR